MKAGRTPDLPAGFAFRSLISMAKMWRHVKHEAKTLKIHSKRGSFRLNVWCVFILWFTVASFTFSGKFFESSTISTFYFHIQLTSRQPFWSCISFKLQIVKGCIWVWALNCFKHGDLPPTWNHVFSQKCWTSDSALIQFRLCVNKRVLLTSEQSSSEGWSYQKKDSTRWR